MVVAGVEQHAGIYDFGKGLDWTIVDVNVTNNGSKKIRFSTGRQAIVADGVTYKVSWTDGSQVNQNNALSETLEPGVTMAFRLPIALPAGVAPSSVAFKVSGEPIQMVAVA